MLEINENQPEGQKIDIEEFDLNTDYRQKFKKNSEIKRQQYEANILRDINMFEMETKDILKKNWTTLLIKPKSIYVCITKSQDI